MHLVSSTLGLVVCLVRLEATHKKEKKVNGLPRPSNQNRMIPIALSPKLLEVRYAAYCTIVSPLPLASWRHTIFAPTPIGTPVGTLALQRAAFRALSFLMPSADVSHARPLRAVPPLGGKGEDYSEFLICMGRRLREQRLWVCKETQRWRGRPLGEEKRAVRGSGQFCSCAALR
jgi:hypothetical protein